jgi:hypothetical protein
VQRYFLLVAESPRGDGAQCQLVGEGRLRVANLI